MDMFKPIKCLIAVWGAVCILATVSAVGAVINGNFCSVANVAAGYAAGLVPTAGWNDYTGDNGFGADQATFLS